MQTRQTDEVKKKHLITNPNNCAMTTNHGPIGPVQSCHTYFTVAISEQHGLKIG